MTELVVMSDSHGWPNMQYPVPALPPPPLTQQSLAAWAKIVGMRAPPLDFDRRIGRN